MRSFGMVRPRPLGAVAKWTENAYCEADKVLRFPSGFGRVPLMDGAHSTSLRCVFRRFFSDGEAILRFETGLTTRRRDAMTQRLTPKAVAHLFAMCLAVEVTVGPKPGGQAAELVAAGNHLSALVRRATERVGAPPSKAWMLPPGVPLLLAQFDDGEIEGLPPYFRRIASLSDATLGCHHAQVQRNGRVVQVFAFQRTTKADPDQIRRARLFVLRRHAEREAAKAVIRAWSQGHLEYERGRADSERLSAWIDGTLKGLAETQAYGFVVGRDVRLALGLDDVISPGERDLLVDEIETMRASIRTRVAAATHESTPAPTPAINYNVSGTVIMAETIGEVDVESSNINTGDIIGSNVGGIGTHFSVQGSFNTIEASQAGDDIKQTLKDLVTAVDEMNKQLPAERTDQAQLAAKRADDIVREATSPQPDKSLLATLAGSLKTVAETVGTVGGPVISVVTALIALL